MNIIVGTAVSFERTLGILVVSSPSASISGSIVLPISFVAPCAMECKQLRQHTL